MLRISKNTRFLFLCVLAIFCFYQTAAAQSGRRVNKNTASSAQKPPVETKPAKTEAETQNAESPVRISSMVVVGEVQHNFTYYKSNEIDAALKECVRVLKSSFKSTSEITRGGGKITYAQAKEQAKKETETFVLWLGFLAKDDGSGNMYIESIQYAVLTPNSAKVLTRGEIQPKQYGVLSSGGVLNIPNVRRRTDSLIQMKDGAREIAGILLRGGWLK
jgi:hypothetical protein